MSPVGGRTGSEGDQALGLEVRNVSKTYSGVVQALADVSLRITSGEFVTLLGPSGSGKTTLLMVIAGFQHPDIGEVLLNESPITMLRPERRSFGVVFQNYALFPHMSVGANVGYPLVVRGMGRAERKAAVGDVLELVGLAGYESRRPNELSGGQQQRVALARALVYRPEVLLLDEPLGALDRALREKMQIELMDIHSRVGCTFLYVTHDQDEALAMSDRVVIMRNGRIEQVGSPEEVYFRPNSEFVATFVGDTNMLPGRVLSVDSGHTDVRLDHSELVTRIPQNLSHAIGDQVMVSVRPDRMRIRPLTTTRDQAQEVGVCAHIGEITGATFLGTGWRYAVRGHSGEVLSVLNIEERHPLRTGQDVEVGWLPSDAWIVPG